VKSVKAARLAVQMGYQKVMVFRGGIPAWVKAGYPLKKTAKYPAVSIPTVSPRDLAAQIKGGAKLFLLDIRGPGMYAKAHLAGAVNIPLFQLHKRLSEIPKDRKIVLIDHAGKQTLTCGRFLKGNGYQNVVRLDGGLMAWMRAGLPVSK